MNTTVHDLLKNAQQESGLSDFGDDWFMGPLAAYLSDLDAPHLSQWGRAFFVRLVLKDLVRKLEIVDCLKHNPEIEDVVLPPILYVTGHERSGTTILHNLLALHRGARYLSRWELMAPKPPRWLSGPQSPTNAGFPARICRCISRTPVSVHSS